MIANSLNDGFALDLLPLPSALPPAPVPCLCDEVFLLLSLPIDLVPVFDKPTTLLSEAPYLVVWMFEDDMARLGASRIKNPNLEPFELC